MKCKYCNAEVLPNAKFCTTCGGDLSKFDKCISCGEFIDKGASTCPHCGAEQLQIVQPQEGSSKKWLWIVGAILLLGILGGGGYYIMSNKVNSPSYVETDSIAEVGDSDFTTGEDIKVIETRLHKIFSALITEDGDKYLPEYFTEGFNTYYKRACEKAMKEGFESPRIWWQESESDPSQFVINSVTPISESEAKSNVTLKSEISECNFEVIVKQENGDWLIDKITQEQEYQQIEEETATLISFEDALRVAEEMQVKDGDFVGFRSPDNVKNIMAKYGYKCEDEYFVEREFYFSHLYYKNCLLAKSSYPVESGNGNPSFVGIDRDGKLVIAPFSKSAFDDFMNQAKAFGGKLKENDESIIEYNFLSFDITGFKQGVFSIKYCIIISKEDEV